MIYLYKRILPCLVKRGQILEDMTHAYPLSKIYVFPSDIAPCRAIEEIKETKWAWLEVVEASAHVFKSDQH